MFSQYANANTSRPLKHLPAFCIQALQGKRYKKKNLLSRRSCYWSRKPSGEDGSRRSAKVNLTRLSKGFVKGPDAG